MKINDALKLESGQKVMHNRYGECIVKEVIRSMGELFGVVITPVTENGRFSLGVDSETNIPDFLEGSVRNITLIDDVIPGSKPIDLETVWGTSEEDMPPQEPKNHVAHEGEGVPE